MCKDCGVEPPNTFSSASKQSECETCETGKTALAKSSSCQDCPAGKAGKSSPEGGCLECEAGRKRGVIDAPSSCVDCTLGRTTLGAKGSTLCTICSAGKYGTEKNNLDVNALGVCTPCPFGTYREGGDEEDTISTICVQCPAGFHQDALGQASCLPCSPGSSQSMNGSTLCVPCSVNFYSDVTRLSDCKACPLGTETQNKTGRAQCQNCIAGKYGAKCFLCAKGMFRAADDTDSTVCDPVNEGHYTDTEGMAVGLPCAPGRYNDQKGEEECKHCPMGQYVFSTAQKVCMPCAPGRGTMLDEPIEEFMGMSIFFRSFKKTKKKLNALFPVSEVFSGSFQSSHFIQL